jgi:hypothetical protein
VARPDLRLNFHRLQHLKGARPIPPPLPGFAQVLAPANDLQLETSGPGRLRAASVTLIEGLHVDLRLEERQSHHAGRHAEVFLQARNRAHPGRARGGPPVKAITASVTFGPSASVNVSRALSYANRYFGVSEIEPGRFVARVGLLDARAPYLRLERLLAIVGSWSTTEVEIAGEIESAALVRSMGSCAAEWLRARGYCGEAWPDGEPWAKCFPCPLFESHRVRRAPDYPPSNLLPA